MVVNSYSPKHLVIDNYRVLHTVVRVVVDGQYRYIDPANFKWSENLNESAAFVRVVSEEDLLRKNFQ
jgi:hypothetical protein